MVKKLEELQTNENDLDLVHKVRKLYPDATEDDKNEKNGNLTWRMVIKTTNV